MIEVKNLTLNSIQLVAITSDISLFSVPKILSNILQKYSDIYDADPSVLPLPQEMPPEIPKVIFESKDGTQKLELAPARTSCYWININDNEPETESIHNTCNEILKYYIESSGIKVNRLGLVVKHTYKTENPAELIIENFCNPKLKKITLNSSKNFEIHNHSVRQLDNLDVNVWIRIKTALLLNKDNGIQPIIAVEQDINTFATEPSELHIFDIQEIETYFLKGFQEIKKELNLYFSE